MLGVRRLLERVWFSIASWQHPSQLGHNVVSLLLHRPAASDRARLERSERQGRQGKKSAARGDEREERQGKEGERREERRTRGGRGVAGR
jgi:hypothetical protein